jgi:CelD/BcsL family acetyltransferase involved in cellulose biosynthesis
MTIQTKILSLSSAIQQYAKQWEQLANAEMLEPTQMPGWLSAISEAFEKDQDIEVWCATDTDDTLLALIPFYRRHSTLLGLTITHLELASTLLSYHALPLGIQNKMELLSLFTNSCGQWHVLNIPNLVCEDESYQALCNQLTADHHYLHAYPTIASPYLATEQNWDAYLASRSRSFRYRLKRKAKAVAKAGEVSLRWIRKAEEVPQLLKEILQIEANSWKVAANMSIAHRPQEQRYYELLLPYMAEKGWLLANVLYIDEVPAAYSLCYDFKGCWGQLKTSFDDRYKDVSPGTHLVDLSVEHAFKENATEFDFLGDRMRHKLEWTDLVRSHCDLYVYNRSNLSGQCLAIIQQLKVFIKKTMAASNNLRNIDFKFLTKTNSKQP